MSQLYLVHELATTDQKVKIMSYVDVDPTLGVVLDKHALHAKMFEDLNSRLRAADGDRAAALQAYISTSDDAQVVKLRTVIEKANAQLNDLAEKNVVSETLSPEDKEKLVTESEELKAKFRDGRKAILSLADTMASMIDMDKVKKALETIGDPTRSGRGRKVGDPGSSLPKASAVLKVSNANDSWTFQTFGEAAKHMAMSVEDLQKAFATAANVDHADIAQVDKPQSFDLESKNGKFTVATEPKARQKPGPRPGGNAAKPTA